MSENLKVTISPVMPGGTIRFHVEPINDAPVSPYELLMLAFIPREEALAIADRSARQCAAERAARFNHREPQEFGEGATVRVVRS